MEYSEFLESKRIAAVPRGMANIPNLASHPFPFQKHCIDFGLRAGSFGCFLDTGLGKTTVELEWSRHAIEASNGYGLILTPLAVARQIEKEGKRWGYDIRVIRGLDVTDGAFRGSDRPLIPATCSVCQRIYYWRMVPEDCPWKGCDGKLR